MTTTSKRPLTGSKPERPSGRGPHDLAGVLGKSLVERWTVFYDQVKRCQRRCTAGSIHVLRVATRRLIATMDIVLAVLPDARLRKARRLLKKFLKAFNELRDVHVQLLASRKLAPQFPLIKAYRTMLLLRRQRLVKAASKQIGAVNTAALEQLAASVEAGLHILFSEPVMQEVGRTAAYGTMAVSFTRALDLRTRVSPSDTRTIHRVRVAFKKFRYTVEVLQPFLGGVDKPFLKSMNAYQLKMGDIQDIEVLTASVNAFTLLRGQSSPESFIPLHQHLARRRMELIKQYLAAADDITKFWKAEHTHFP